MTAGSEYNALGAARGFRGVEPEEGRQIFLDLLTESPAGGARVLLTDAEIEHFHPRLAVDDGGSARRSAELRPQTPVDPPPSRTWTLDPRVDPWMTYHRARSGAVAAGAFLVELATRHALATHPGAGVVREIRDARFLEFLRLPDHAARHVRTVTTHHEPLEAGRVASSIEVRGDFVHASGVVLRADVVFATCIVELGPTRDLLAPRHAGRVDGPSIPDPYARPGAPVRHAGWFDHLGTFTLGPALKAGVFRLTPDRALEALRDAATPFLLLDALLTLGILRRDETGALPVCAARGMGRIRFGSVTNDLAIRAARGPVRLFATVPRAGDRVHSAWSQALDTAGSVLLDVEGLEGHVLGHVAVDASAPSLLPLAAP
jgi:hypothetical protein